jgi:hypothetical protein
VLSPFLNNPSLMNSSPKTYKESRKFLTHVSPSKADNRHGNDKKILHDGSVTPAYRQAGLNDENAPHPAPPSRVAVSQYEKNRHFERAERRSGGKDLGR